ncbi:MAG: hypothetical protein K2O03_14415, partial [Lachnospiraceae bacterium]|nr:hypothetical protein [Lachnospiraceae bacterium]
MEGKKKLSRTAEGEENKNMRKYFKTEKAKKEWKKALCALLCSATVLAGCGDAGKEGTQENVTPTQGANQGSDAQGTPTPQAGQDGDSQDGVG